MYVHLNLFERAVLSILRPLGCSAENFGSTETFGLGSYSSLLGGVRGERPSYLCTRSSYPWNSLSSNFADVYSTVFVNVTVIWFFFDLVFRADWL